MNTEVIDRAQEQGSAAAAGQCEEFDVLVVGAGISGLGCGHYLRQYFPEKTFAILDKMEDFGGTWLIHRYPGARSDSDLFTFGYEFKPWEGDPIASRRQILDYLGEVIEDDNLRDVIRFNHEVKKASWCSKEKKWTLTAETHGQVKQFKAHFLMMCPGYYKHEEGNMPNWEGFENYKGEVIHPQNWPKDYDYSGKKIVIIGSGATAATLLPSLTDKAAHVTMLQRSPTYFFPGRNGNDLLDELRRLNVKPEWIHEIMRAKTIADRDSLVAKAHEDPQAVRDYLLGEVRKILRDDIPMDPAFTPRYDPWTQRVAFVPEGDLIHAINRGDASVVTDEIDHFTETGIQTKSGQNLEADLIITATGFHIEKLGAVDLEFDGKPLVWSDTVTYRGCMFTGIPNMIYMLGYWTFSWTLRVDIVCKFMVRMLKWMDENNVTSIEPKLRPEDEKEERLGWVDTAKFNPGYARKAVDIWPKRLDKPEWQHSQNYPLDKEQFPKVDFNDDIFVKTVG